MKKTVIGALALSLIALSCGTGDQPIATSRNAAPGETLPPVETAAPSTGPLSLDDALLVEADVALPWEAQWRNLDSFAYEIDGTQTDCPAFGEYEQLTRFPSGELLWWRDGGNLNNIVRRIDDSTSASALLDVFSDLPTTCPTTSWSEGDFFTIEPLDLGVDGVVGLAFVDRTNERKWLAFAQHGDLLGELRLTLWPEFETGTHPEVSLADFASTATLMRDRLRAAGPVATPQPTITTTAVPVPTSTEPAPPTVVTLPIVPTLPTSVPVVGGLASAALTAQDLPAGWHAHAVETFDDGASNAEGEENLPGCPPSASLNALERAFRFEVQLDPVAESTIERATQWIGEFEDVQTAIDVVAEFSTIGDCDIAELIPDASFDSAFATIAGADSAATLSFTAPDDQATASTVITVAVVGRIVTAVSVYGDTDQPATQTALDLTSAAVAKILATGLD